MGKLSDVKLNRDHWHGGDFYKAGEPISVSAKRREFFSIRGMIAEPKSAKNKAKEN